MARRRKEPKVLKYLIEKKEEREEKKKENFVKFTDEKDKTQFGVANDRFYLATAQFTIAVFIGFILKLILLSIILAVALNYFGIISLTDIFMRIPPISHPILSRGIAFLSKIVTYLPKK